MVYGDSMRVLVIYLTDGSTAMIDMPDGASLESIEVHIVEDDVESMECGEVRH